MMKLILSICLCIPLLATAKVAPKTPGGRIIGGEPASSGEFPFAAAIYVSTPDIGHFCGGALISDQWILTAGQCVVGAVSFTIQLGSNRLSGSDSNRVTVAANEWVLHPNYNRLTLENDVALIKLRVPVEYNDYIREVHYLPVAQINDGVAVTSIGWGDINDRDDELAENLNAVTLATISTAECQKTYSDQVTDKMLCATGNFNEGTCTGDTGSPLLLRMNDLSMHVGIASFHSGNGCESRDPSGYTRTFTYVDWIKNVTKDW